MRRRQVFVVVLLLNVSISIFGQSAVAPIETVSVLYSGASVEWPDVPPDRGTALTVSGPGLYLKSDCASGVWPRFSLLNDQGQARPDGLYKWELVVQREWGAESRTESGWFRITGGRAVAEGRGEEQPVVIENEAPRNSLYIDGQGRVGVGTSVPGAQLHVKGAAPAMAIEDTQAGGREYRLRGQETGSIGLFDETTGQARWLVDEQGRMGVNTTKPSSTLTVDGYIESTKGFLVNGRPAGGFGLIGGSRPLWEGPSNTWYGTNAGNGTMTGLYNSFFGLDSGKATTSGSGNTFMGWGTGGSNASGNDNSIFGAAAGVNTTGSDNAFFGKGAGYQNSDGGGNSFFGAGAGENNATSYNSAFGNKAGWLNTNGYYNAFFGAYAGYLNQSGDSNSFFGALAGSSNTSEKENTFVGTLANLDPGADPVGSPITNATAIGYRAYVARPNSLVLGSIAGVNGATSYVNVGIGLTNPVRQLHLRGPNAVFRMDREVDTAAFILCRTSDGVVLKSFVVGTNASGTNNGTFIIMDTGTAAGGAGTERMTIQNDGTVVFSGNVFANSFTPTSSIAFKTNVRTLDSALDLVGRLRGVRFDWKSNGQPSVGLIAEEVEKVIPEVVAKDEDDRLKAVNYSSLVAVLVEAIKEQQEEIAGLKARLERVESRQ